MFELKNTNPKDAVGTQKVPFSTVPAPFVAEVGLAMLEGACKYGRHNYRAAGVRASVYYDAALRHLTAWWEGQDVDAESGMSHLIKAAACMAVLSDSIRRGNWTDDRPPSVDGDWIGDLNKKAAAILEKYPNRASAHVRTITAESTEATRAEVEPLKAQLAEAREALRDAAIDLGECGMVGRRDKYMDIADPPNNPFASHPSSPEAPKESK